jgi:hypothetical protein
MSLTSHFKVIKGEPKEGKFIWLLKLSVEAVQMALSAIYIKARFSKAGIWPFSAQAPSNLA